MALRPLPATGSRAGRTTRHGSASCSTRATRGSNGRPPSADAGSPGANRWRTSRSTRAANAPYISVNFVGLMHAGPTIIAEGSDEQRAFHLPRILRGESVWCQGFSEPAAGSDLASLHTRAERRGDEYVVNGQKIWSTRAHVADYCELLVRTDSDAPKHKGITWLILDMHQPGVEVRPMRTIDGESHFCEVFLDDARVPVANRVGDENDGWRVTNVTLRFERGTAFAEHIITLRSQIRALVELALATPVEGGSRGMTSRCASTSAACRRASTRSGA